MKNQFTLLVALVVVAFLLAYMFAFQVRYDQVAVVTTFGSATPPKYNADGTLARNAKGQLVNPGSLKFQPGLYFKWPWPIQSVQKYRTQVQILKGQPTEIQTADNYSVIISTYLAWKISDPIAFFRSLATPAHAKDQLTSLLSDANDVISHYRFSDLVNDNPKLLKIREIEQKCAQQIQGSLSKIKPSYGVKVVQFGIRRMVLPGPVTKQVFARMRATRERLAAYATSEGKAQAVEITSRADSEKQRILAFANAEAQALRTKGDREAAAYYTAFDKDQRFAVFLREIESLKSMLSHNTTFIMPAKDLGPLNLFQGGIDSLLNGDKHVNAKQASAGQAKNGNRVQAAAAGK